MRPRELSHLAAHLLEDSATLFHQRLGGGPGGRRASPPLLDHWQRKARQSSRSSRLRRTSVGRRDPADAAKTHKARAADAKRLSRAPPPPRARDARRRPPLSRAGAAFAETGAGKADPAQVVGEGDEHHPRRNPGQCGNMCLSVESLSWCLIVRCILHEIKPVL